MAQKRGVKKAAKGAVAKTKPKVVDTVDHALVDEALKEIKKRLESVSESFNRGILDIGNFVFAKFFGSDPKQVEFRGRKKNSFRALADHPELPISRSWLHSAVAAARQEAMLLKAGAADIKKISATHQVELLKVRGGIPEKRRLIEAIINEKLSVRVLQERIERKTLPPASGEDEASADGRPFKLPRFMEKLMAASLDAVIPKRRLAKLSQADRKRYRGALEKAGERIDKMIKELDSVRED